MRATEGQGPARGAGLATQGDVYTPKGDVYTPKGVGLVVCSTARGVR